MIRGIVDFSHWSMRSILRHPALNTPDGKRRKRLGRGTFAAVYEAERPGRVLKVTLDKYAYMIHCDPVCKVTGRFMPKVYHDYGAIGEYKGHEVYMVELERLIPARKRNVNSWSIGGELPRGAMQKLREFTHQFNGCELDIHEQNVMRRARTGDLVASDPVADMQMIRTLRRGHTW